MLEAIFATQKLPNSRKRIYRWFVYYDIDGAVPTIVLAAIFRTIIMNQTAFDTLLKSEHFFDILAKGRQIKVG